MELFLLLILLAFCALGAVFIILKVAFAWGTWLASIDRTKPIVAPTTIDNSFYDNFDPEASIDYWWSLSGPLGSLHEINPPRIEYFDEVIQSKFAGRDRSEIQIVDIGCGGGILTEALAKLGYSITGIDMSPHSITAARIHAKQEGVAVQYLVGNAYDVCPDIMAPQSVDCVIMSDVLEHLHDLPRTFSQVHQLLRPVRAKCLGAL